MSLTLQDVIDHGRKHIEVLVIATEIMYGGDEHTGFVMINSVSRGRLT